MSEWPSNYVLILVCSRPQGGVEGYAEGQSSSSAASNQRGESGAGSETRHEMPGRDQNKKRPIPKFLCQRQESGVSDDDICRSFEQEEVLGLNPVENKQKANLEVSDT